MKFHRLLTMVLCVCALAAGACSGKKPVSPRNQLGLRAVSHSSSSKFTVGPDLDIQRAYSDPPPTGRIPTAMAWSPDGKTLAYLRVVSRPNNREQRELWTYDIKSRRDYPVPLGGKMDVEMFRWRGNDGFIVASDGDLFLVNENGKTTQLTDTVADEQNAMLSPDGQKLAYVREDNLIVLDLEKVKERPVTTSGNGLLRYGVVSWVYQEEFGTHDGFQWSPDGTSLWFYATDESAVPARTVISDAKGNTYLQAYPRAGEPNPRKRVGVVQLANKNPKVVWLDTNIGEDYYLPRVAWLPSGRSLSVVRFDRLQTMAEVLVCEAAHGSCQSIVEEIDPRWVALGGDPLFFGDGHELLWLSEKSGYSHIYRVGRDGKGRFQLTDGSWNVRSIDFVDTASKLVYFTANISYPYEYGLYVVPLAGGKVQQVSVASGCHNVVFSSEGKLFADAHSALDRPPKVEIFEASGERVGTVARRDLGRYEMPGVTNDIFPIQTRDGTKIWALMTRPQVLEPDRKYPVLVYVYGGPNAQVVKNHFRPKYQIWREMMASRGILVFTVDGRGSGGRSKEFAASVHLKLGQLEMQDQLDGVAYLKSQPYVARDRLAVFGWSFGGFMAIKALLDHPSLFKAGVAVAPVTDWLLYDSAYTERYMQRPEDNPEGYEQGSLLKKAGKLKAPLLLIHGLADDNVHPANSTLLIDALVNESKQFDLMLYPGKKHGISGSKTRIDLFTRITRFIERHL